MVALPSRLEVLGAGANTGFLHWIVMIALILLERLGEAVDEGRVAGTLLVHEGDEFRLPAALALLAGSTLYLRTIEPPPATCGRRLALAHLDVDPARLGMLGLRNA